MRRVTALAQNDVGGTRACDVLLLVAQSLQIDTGATNTAFIDCLKVRVGDAAIKTSAIDSLAPFISSMMRP